jgi:hypothetical protein
VAAPDDHDAPPASAREVHDLLDLGERLRLDVELGTRVEGARPGVVEVVG